MKLDAVLKIVAPFLATDKKPEDLKAAILAADASMPGNVASSKEIMDKRGKDRAARDKARDEERAARDKARDEEREKEDEKRSADRKARDEKMEADRKARDAKFGAEDRDDDPEHTNDEEMKSEAEDEAAAEKKAEDEDYTEGADPSTPGGSRAGGKTAVDSAEVDKRIAAAVAADRDAREALYAARREVEPILGVVTFDSAPAAYRAALKHLEVDVKGVPDAALPAMLKLAKDRAAAPAPALGMDSAGTAAIEKIIPGYGRLR